MSIAWTTLRPAPIVAERGRRSNAQPAHPFPSLLPGGLMQQPFRKLVIGLALAAAPLFAAAQTVPIVGLVEQSGAGATAGTNFDNGVKLAVNEINAAGGLAGGKIAYTSYDTQTNP